MRFEPIAAAAVLVACSGPQRPAADGGFVSAPHRTRPPLSDRRGAVRVADARGEPACGEPTADHLGAVLDVTLQVPATVVPGDWAVIRILSFHEGGGNADCADPLTDDPHFWPVGVYVN